MAILFFPLESLALLLKRRRNPEKRNPRTPNISILPSDFSRALGINLFFRLALFVLNQLNIVNKINQEDKEEDKEDKEEDKEENKD